MSHPTPPPRPRPRVERRVLRDSTPNLLDVREGGSESLLEHLASHTTPSPRADALSWQEQALCIQTDPEVFFPEKGGSARPGKRTCHRCEVRAECLAYALANDERSGIWGGTTGKERRRLQRTLRGAGAR